MSSSSNIAAVLYDMEQENNPKREYPKNPDLSSLDDPGRCPDCGGAWFLHGPRGGMAENIRCFKCGHEFAWSPPFPAERLDRDCLELYHDAFDLRKEIEPGLEHQAKLNNRPGPRALRRERRLFGLAKTIRAIVGAVWTIPGFAGAALLIGLYGTRTALVAWLAFLLVYAWGTFWALRYYYRHKHKYRA